MVESRLSRMSAALLNMIKEKLTKSSLKVTIQERRQKEGNTGRQAGRKAGRQAGSREGGGREGGLESGNKAAR